VKGRLRDVALGRRTAPDDFFPQRRQLGVRGEEEAQRTEKAEGMMNSLFADLPVRLPEELFSTLLDAANVRIERIFSHGHASTEDFCYDQEQHEWVVLLKGAARLR
jgi:hypothetical protein